MICARKKGGQLKMIHYAIRLRTLQRVLLSFSFIGKGQQHLVCPPLVNETFLFPLFFTSSQRLIQHYFPGSFLHSQPHMLEKVLSLQKGAFVSDTSIASSLISKPALREAIGCVRKNFAVTMILQFMFLSFGRVQFL